VERLHDTIRELDAAMRDAEVLRAQLERSRHRQPFWPDRREPKHWSADEITSHEVRGKGET